MKKILIGSVNTILIASFLIVPVAIFAEEEAPTLDIMDLLDNVVNWMFSILLVVAAIFIIVSAFYFVTAQGDADKTKTARNFVLFALIGVLVAFAARGLVELVRTIAGA